MRRANRKKASAKLKGVDGVLQKMMPLARPRVVAARLKEVDGVPQKTTRLVRLLKVTAHLRDPVPVDFVGKSRAIPMHQLRTKCQNKQPRFC